VRYGLVGSASTGQLVEILDERVIGRALAANQGRDATISLTGAPLGGFALGLSTALVAPLLQILDLLGLVGLSAAVLVVLLNRSLRGIPRPEDLKEYAVSRVSREAHPRREPAGTTTS